VSPSPSPDAPTLVTRALATAARRWPLVPIRIGARLLAALLLVVGIAPMLFPFFRFAFDLARTGDAVPENLSPDELIDLLRGSLPWIGLGLITLLVFGTIAFALAIWVRGGMLGELAREGEGFSGSSFASSGRRFFWRLFWIETTYQCILIAVAGIAMLFFLVLLSLSGSLEPEELAEKISGAATGPMADFGLLAIVILVSPLTAIVRLASAGVAARDIGAGEAFSGAFAAARRRPATFAGALGLLAAAGLLLLLAGSGIGIAFRQIGGKEGPGCSILALLIAARLFLFLLDAMADVLFGAGWIGLALLAQPDAGSAGPPPIPSLLETAEGTWTAEPGPNSGEPVGPSNPAADDAAPPPIPSLPEEAGIASTAEPLPDGGEPVGPSNPAADDAAPPVLPQDPIPLPEPAPPEAEKPAGESAPPTEDQP
jgi:fumarate reductase subunit D